MKTSEIRLHEATDRITLPEGGGDKYKIRIIAAGEGSSGIYPIEMLERDTPGAFPKGTRMRANHDGLCEDGGDIRRVIAKTIDDPWREGDEMYTNIRVAEGWNTYFREFADAIGVSISAAGELEPLTKEQEEAIENGEDPGKRIVARLFSAEESPYNAIDFVEAPGAGGRIVMAIEGAKKQIQELNIREQASFASPRLDEKNSGAVPPQSSKKKEGYSMDEEERKLIVAETAAAVVEAIKPAEPVAEDVKFESVAEAAFKAGLSEAGREAVYERVRNGASVDEAIAKERTREDAIEASVKEKLASSGSSHQGFGYTVGEDEGAGASRESLDAEYESMLEEA